MNVSKFVFTVLLALAGMGICPSLGEPLDGEAFIESLREHNRNSTQLEFNEQLRKAISQDESGDLIITISLDPEINSALFYNLDVIPVKFLLIVIARWLEEDNQ
ncbi:hypothetical protein HNR46_003855 [Haloferula luteola]|uniref:Uncharacterized protein n=1 Tax=Haloferula luteola TaxID=595692 RepID=A0A840VDK6_9BACT|nr:hypothetical protein [Haloferula luteola]MBB5353594.1 hypothetical protein [Haloferula luteola]